jgi:hypothetical protein
MSVVQHTEGPWHTAGEQGVQIRSAKHQIAKVWTMRGNEWKANAKLIAAAPDLLAALKDAAQALAFLKSIGIQSSTIDAEIRKSRVAISKAETLAEAKGTQP